MPVRKEDQLRECERGFTLVELMFVMLLFPLLFLSVYSVIDMARVIFNTSGVYSQLNQSAMQTLRYVSREVGQSSPIVSPSHLTVSTDANGNDVVTFQIPVDYDNDGDVVTSNLDPDTEWGAYNDVGQTQSGNFNFWTQYRVINNQLIRRLLNASQVTVTGSDRVITNNVQAFAITQNGNILTMTITLLGTDTIGQRGSARTITQSFSSNTVLRNAVT